MRFRRLLIASAMIAVTAPAMATGSIHRCENLAPLITPNPPIVSISYKSNSNVYVSGSIKCTFAPAGVRACPDVNSNGSLSTPVVPTQVIQTVTNVPPTETPQFRDGELDIKKTAVASAKASKEATQNAPENQGKPFWEWTPHVVIVEVVDWNAPQTGTCN